MSDICKEDCGHPDDGDMNGLSDDLENQLQDVSPFFARAKKEYASIEIPADYPDKIRELIEKLNIGSV